MMIRFCMLYLVVLYLVQEYFLSRNDIGSKWLCVHNVYKGQLHNNHKRVMQNTYRQKPFTILYHKTTPKVSPILLKSKKNECVIKYSCSSFQFFFFFSLMHNLKIVLNNWVFYVSSIIQDDFFLQRAACELQLMSYDTNHISEGSVACINGVWSSFLTIWITCTLY